MTDTQVTWLTQEAFDKLQGELEGLIANRPIIAAEITGRACHAIELMPQYVDVSIQRWQAFTGETAKLEESGETFAEVTTERQAADAS